MKPKKYSRAGKRIGKKTYDQMRELARTFPDFKEKDSGHTSGDQTWFSRTALFSWYDKKLGRERSLELQYGSHINGSILNVTGTKSEWWSIYYFFEDQGLGYNQISCLMHILDKGPSRIKDIGYGGNTVGRALRSLFVRGYVSKDGFVWSLTGSGLELATEMNEERDFIDRFLGGEEKIEYKELK